MDHQSQNYLQTKGLRVNKRDSGNRDETKSMAQKDTDVKR